MKKREIIAFIGRQGSGKSYQARRLEKERGFKRLSFADPLREIAFNTIGLEFAEGMAKYDELKRTEIVNGLNFRNILENLGSSVRKYDVDFWVNALITTIRNSTEDIVIDDMRYPNEYDLLRSYCVAQNYNYRVYFCDHRSAAYDADNRHESAALSNYLAQIGYVDSQLVNKKDIFAYKSLLNRRDIKKPNKPMPALATNPASLKQQGDELLNLLKRRSGK